MAEWTIPTGYNGNIEDLQREWARQTGADYDTVFGGGGNTQTTTGGTTGGNTNHLADFGWDNNLPGLDVPSLSGGNTSTVQIIPSTTQPNNPLAELGWGDNLPGTNVPSLSGGNTQPDAGSAYPYLQEYMDYYTSRNMSPDRSYDDWVANVRGRTQTNPTQPTQPTNPTQPSDPTQQLPQGLSVQDYINYYGGDWTKADKSYDEWVAWMQRGGGTQSATPTNTAELSRENYLKWLRETYPNGGPVPSYDDWVAMQTGGTGGTQQPTGEQPTQGGQQTTPSTQDLQAEWSTLMQKYANGTITIQEALRLQELQNYLYGGGTNPGAGIGGGTGIGGGSVIGGGSMIHELPPIAYDRTQMIRDMYDAQINAERAALQEQGEQALSDAQANRDKIADTYNKQRNAASVDWERQRRNFLEGAMTSGLNTGAGSQAELSMMSMYQRNQNELGAAQAGAEAEADRNIADIKRSTQAAINEAVSKNDYQKAAALLDEYKDAYNREMDRAEALASFGDFSGYANIYGEEAARQMASNWAMQNPEVALAMGLITQQQYAQLTLYSKYPALALTGGTGFSGGGGGGDYSGGGGGTSDWQYGATYNMGELIDAAAAGMSRSQIEQALTERGIDVTQPTVQADITTALSK